MTPRKPTVVRRTEIADAALGIVATRGIAALSTRVLAEAVGLSTGALFKHFQNRDAILVGVAHRVQELLAETFPEESLAPRERLRQLAQARLTVVSARAGVLTLVLSEQFAMALPDEAVRILRDAVGQTHAFVERAIRDGQAEGSIRRDVPSHSLALLLMGALQMTALARRTGAVRGAPEPIEALDILFRPTQSQETP